MNRSIRVSVRYYFLSRQQRFVDNVCWITNVMKGICKLPLISSFLNVIKSMEFTWSYRYDVAIYAVLMSEFVSNKNNQIRRGYVPHMQWPFGRSLKWLTDWSNLNLLYSLQPGLANQNFLLLALATFGRVVHWWVVLGVFFSSHTGAAALHCGNPVCQAAVYRLNSKPVCVFEMQKTYFLLHTLVNVIKWRNF